jgi:hypothetical protein
MHLVPGTAVLLHVTVAATSLTVAVTLAGIKLKAGNILRGLIPRDLVRRFVRDFITASLAAAIRTSTYIVTVHLSVEVPGLVKRRLVHLANIEIVAWVRHLLTNTVLVMVMRAKVDPTRAGRVIKMSLITGIATPNVTVLVAVVPV